MNWNLRAAAAAAAALIIAGCNRDVSNARDLPVWKLPDTPEYTVGGDVAFANIVGVVHLTDGRLVVADSVAGTLHVFRDGLPKGDWTLGRVHGLAAYRADSVAVWDAAARRVSIVAPDGNVARYVTPPIDTTDVAGYVTRPTIDFAGAFDDGSLVFVGPERVSLSGSSPARGTRTLYSVSADGVPADTLASVDAGLWAIEGEHVIAFELGIPLVSVARAERVVYGNGSTFTLHSADTRLAPSIDYATKIPPRPVTPAVRAWQEEGYRVTADSARDRSYPQWMPAYRRAVVTTGGELWLERFQPAFEERNASYAVFAAGGEQLAWFTIERNARVVDATTSHVHVVHRDAAGVETIRVYGRPVPDTTATLR